MTTRYRVEYALKTHRRDQLIEWIKGLLAVPFVLHSQPALPNSKQDEQKRALDRMAESASRRYLEIMQDVEDLINDHIAHRQLGNLTRSKLKYLVPSVGDFFTPLYLREAFEHQDKIRRISSRRFVAPSFNDIRLTLNTAQLLSLSRNGPLDLITFDGDVTLYDDGQSLTGLNPVIPRLLRLLATGICVGIVTAAGYTEASKYHGRLHGLLDAIKQSMESGELSNPRLLVLGGESNYLFQFDHQSSHCLRYIDRREWMLPEMHSWTEKSITSLLDVAEGALRECIQTMDLPAEILRKDRAVGMVPSTAVGSGTFTREQLEETVLVTQQVVEASAAGKQLPFCAFNGEKHSDHSMLALNNQNPGGNDVFVDIGDKAWGVQACQRFFGGIDGGRSLHVGDQFLSAGANDFKARSACTTAWIASPAETVQLLDELDHHTHS